MEEFEGDGYNNRELAWFIQPRQPSIIFYTTKHTHMRQPKTCIALGQFTIILAHLRDSDIMSSTSQAPNLAYSITIICNLFNEGTPLLPRCRV